MATAGPLVPTSVVSSSGFTGATAANLAGLNDGLAATGGRAGSFIVAHITDAPLDFNALTSITLQFRAQVIGNATRPKSVTLTIEDAAGTTLATFGATAISGTATTYASGVIAPGAQTKAQVDDWRIRAAISEGGGKADSATVTLDYMAVETLTYEVAAVESNVSIAATLPALAATATVTHAVPGRTVNIAATLPALAASAAASHAPPTFAVTAAGTLPALTASAGVKFGAPSFSVDAAAVLPALEASATVTRTVPTFSVSAAGTLPALSAAVSASFGAPGYTVSLGATLSALRGAVGVLHAIPGRSVAVAATLPALTASVGISHAAPGVPTYRVNAGAELPALMANAAVTYMAPMPAAEYAVQLGATLPALQAAATVRNAGITPPPAPSQQVVLGGTVYLTRSMQGTVSIVRGVSMET